MKLCYEQYDQNYIRVDLMPQRGGALSVDVSTLKLSDEDSWSVQANTITEPTHGHSNTFHNASWTKFLMQPGQTADITCAGQSCHIQYSQDKKVYLSGELPIAPYYNGVLTAEEDGFSEYVSVKE